jgi:predicted transcriptional regulator of viral defense system
MVAHAGRRVSWKALLDCLRRFGESAVVQRLGYLLELHRIEVSPETLAALRGLVNPGSKITLGSRARWGAHGPLSRTWNVIENVPAEVLLAGNEQRERRVTFPKGRRR